ncbi:MAG TPA: tRNA 2-thiouridine(34) synthase MnmA [bacterium]|nr:tRNA 2-thiouridine(34) synthase MnmA [bacterium]
MKNKNNKKVIIAISGGVDSSVAAKLLKDSGYDVMGIFLHFWKDELEIGENKCCSLESLADAQRVCRTIGIPLYTLNFSKPFKKEVVDNFLAEYKSGRTPNPCVVCNKKIKLGLLIKKAEELGFDYVATGHYVKTKKSGGIVKMYKAVDANKDQSYFLHKLSQDQLKKLIFPLGDYRKDEVRVLARQFKLPTATKKESQEICFVSDKGHNEFLKRYLKLKPGSIRLMNGEKIGEHKGLPLYTIGQRRGIEIGGRGPYYAAKMDYKTNTLFVTDSANDQILFGNSLIAKDVNWIAGREPKMPFFCEAVIRYRHKPIKCKVKKLSSLAKATEDKKVESNVYEVKFKEPQRAITAGQSVVFYKGDELLGGGIID